MRGTNVIDLGIAAGVSCIFGVALCAASAYKAHSLSLDLEDRSQDFYDIGNLPDIRSHVEPTMVRVGSWSC